MTWRIWFTSVGTGLKITRAEPINMEHATVSVRAAQGAALWDGVWVNGERSYDTYVLVDGEAQYHAPGEHLARTCFEIHEAAGGGHPVR